MSLHCPATVIVARADGDHRAVTGGLRDRRVAAVYTSLRTEAVAVGRVIAQELGAVATASAGLGGVAAEPATTHQEAVLRYHDELRALADLHRGETILVLVPTSPPGEAVVAELEIGDDGIRFVT